MTCFLSVAAVALSIVSLALVADDPSGSNTSAPPSEDPPVIHPMWTRTPSPRHVVEAHPKIARGTSGFATIVCRVDTKGDLEKCEVGAESGEGFGAAGLSLAKRFRMKMTDKDGLPVFGRSIRIPIRFYQPGATGP